MPGIGACPVRGKEEGGGGAAAAAAGGCLPRPLPRHLFHGGLTALRLPAFSPHSFPKKCSVSKASAVFPKQAQCLFAAAAPGKPHNLRGAFLEALPAPRGLKNSMN